MILDGRGFPLAEIHGWERPAMSHFRQHEIVRELAAAHADLKLDDALVVAHRIIGWLLIGCAVLIVLTAAPRRGSRAAALVFAAIIVLVVVTGCAAPADAATGIAVQSTASGNLGLVGATVLLAVLSAVVVGKTMSVVLSLTGLLFRALWMWLFGVVILGGAIGLAALVAGGATR